MLSKSAKFDASYTTSGMMTCVHVVDAVNVVSPASSTKLPGVSSVLRRTRKFSVPVDPFAQSDRYL